MLGIEEDLTRLGFDEEAMNNKLRELTPEGREIFYMALLPHDARFLSGSLPYRLEIFSNPSRLQLQRCVKYWVSITIRCLMKQC